MSMRRDLIKQSWEGATGGWGVDNRRARRIDRKRRKREAEREIVNEVRPVSENGICYGPHDNCAHLMDEDRW